MEEILFTVSCIVNYFAIGYGVSIQELSKGKASIANIVSLLFLILMPALAPIAVLGYSSLKVKKINVLHPDFWWIGNWLVDKYEDKPQYHEKVLSAETSVLAWIATVLAVLLITPGIYLEQNSTKGFTEATLLVALVSVQVTHTSKTMFSAVLSGIVGVSALLLAIWQIAIQ